MTSETHSNDELRTRIEERAKGLSGGRSGGVRLQDGIVTVALDVSGLDAPVREDLSAQLRDGLLLLPEVTDVRVAMTAQRKARTIIAVGSGKGGVGKSTLATNIAIALSRLGRKVGMVDADIYGPSQPRLLGREDTRPEAQGDKLVPVMSPHGIPFLSMGQLAKPGQAIAWRGPMAGRALEQLTDAHWGDVDLLIVDLPPGTGDIQLSMLQKFKPAGAVIVSTPQDLALIDAARAITLFRDAGVPVIGMVENMAGYACPHCGEVSDPFGNGGAESEAAALDMPFLGRVPLDRSIRLGSDAGVPPVAQGGSLAEPFTAIAARIDGWITSQSAGG
ncbi:Mrp/NBP35 family ATP-binding protein [Sphingomonas lacunae]|uniref:Iron-sulfur cluster carrier protein n=1 Tax=Sphingomonas lacunae TaxID=2698828 RepID=A0A6M4ASH7_9SPHN|nr:Mrp/NBP35 family ATP-binding protein [Sphingomonas lacunae]QJQ32037.1 Mrp/NBP35 family ATP-binding protein [Sphingomonas lacunae]